MKQKTRTLSEAVKTFPEYWSNSIGKDIPENFYSLSYLEKLNVFTTCRTNAEYICSVKNDKLFFGLKVTKICRSGKKFYPKHTWSNCICIENNKITVSRLSISGLLTFLKLGGLQTDYIMEETKNQSIWRSTPELFFIKPVIIGDILRKKICSSKTFYKAVRSKIYKLKEIDWKVLRDYLKIENFIPIMDLKDFTKDYFKSMKVISKYSEVCPSIYRDLITYAIKLNEKVDFCWSEKRMHEEHIRQIRQVQLAEIEDKVETPVFSEEINGPSIKMLNSEKEVFLEGLVMHHCLYACYWHKINAKKYIAFHMSAPEDCTFSYRLRNNEVILDQAFLAYDKKISGETQKVIDKFTKENAEKIKKLLMEEVSKAEHFAEDILPY